MMRLWDLSSGAAKLETAMDALKEAAEISLEEWDDQTHRAFQEKYVLPLEPRVRRAMDAIHRLAEELEKAQRACGLRGEIL
jgi:hypothetical protein